MEKSWHREVKENSWQTELNRTEPNWTELNWTGAACHSSRCQLASCCTGIFSLSGEVSRESFFGQLHAHVVKDAGRWTKDSDQLKVVLVFFLLSVFSGFQLYPRLTPLDPIAIHSKSWLFPWPARLTKADFFFSCFDAFNSGGSCLYSCCGRGSSCCHRPSHLYPVNLMGKLFGLSQLKDQ